MVGMEDRLQSPVLAVVVAAVMVMVQVDEAEMERLRVEEAVVAELAILLAAKAATGPVEKCG